MTAFVLIPGAGGVAWYWHPVVPLLEAAGHEVLAVDLFAGDGGLEGYARRVVAAIGDRREVTVVAHSLGGFTAPLVCARASVGGLVFVNAMIPAPGQTPADWGRSTGSDRARTVAARRGGYSEEYSDAVYCFHDVPAALAEEAARHDRDEAPGTFEAACAFTAWPDVPIRVIAGRDDRVFPLDLQRRVARDRLGRDVDVVAGGHLLALANPRGLAEALLAGA